MELVKAEKFLCVFSLIEIILKDIGISDWDQLAISKEFDIVVPFGYSGPILNARFSNKAWELGAHLDLISINKFLDQSGSGYQCKYFPWNFMSEVTFEETIGDELLAGNYLLVTFSYGDLYKEYDLDDVGHSGLVLGIYEDYIQMYDPGPRACGVKNIRFYDLFHAMQKKQGGMYSFHKVDKQGMPR